MVKGMMAQVVFLLDPAEEGEGHEEDWMHPMGQQQVAQQVSTADSCFMTILFED